MKQWKTLQTSSLVVHYSTLSSINKVSAWPNRMNRYFIANGYLYFISNPCVSICLISWPMITTTGSLKTRETLVVSKLTTSHQLKISHPNWNMNSDYTPPRIKMSNYTTNCQTALLFFSYQFLCTQLSHWITKFCSAYLSTCETTATYAKSEMMALFQTNWQTFIVHVFLRTETYCLVCNRCHTTDNGTRRQKCRHRETQIKTEE